MSRGEEFSMKETVLLIGSSESLKTGSLIQVAIDNPEMPCWVFDAENSVERTAIFFGGVPANLTVVRGEKGQVATGIGDMLWGMKNTVFPALVGKPEGYGAVLINNLTNIEERSAESVAEARFPDGGMAEAISTAGEKNERAVNPDFTPSDWKTMSARTNALLPIYKLQCHMFIAAEAKKLISGIKGSIAYLNAPEQLADVWGEVGVVPDANRHITFNTSTGVLLEASGLTVRSLKVSLVRDRSRVMFEPAVKFVRERVEPAEVRFKGTPKQTPVYNIWRFLAGRVPGWTWPLPVVGLPEVKVG